MGKSETKKGNILVVALIGIVVALGAFLISFITTQRAAEERLDPKIKNLKIPPIEIPERAPLAPLLRPSPTPSPIPTAVPVVSPQPSSSPQP